MSETTSAPAPAPSSDTGAVSPPANSQQPISVSDAARLLNQQRRKDAGEPAAPAEPGRRPSANEMVQEAKAAAINPGDKAINPGDKAINPAQTGLSAMERALGVPGVAAPEGQAAPADTGGTLEIEGQRYSQAQLREAVLKASDYTKKTQEIAQQRQALQEQQNALATVLPYIQPELQRLAQTLQRGDGAQMPDPSLAETDPTRYVRERAAYDAAMAEQQRLGNLTMLQQQAHARAMDQQVAAGNEALAKEFPFWADPQQRLEAQQQIVEWATNKGGFTKDELRGLSDPRHLKAMMKAAMFDRWTEGVRTAAPAAQLQAPVRGSPPPAPPTVRVQEAMQRFEAKPDVRSATALLSARRATNGQTR